jgi:hypothetical protein
MKRIRVNVHCITNAKPRDEMRNGRKVKVVSAATLPDNIVMNRLLYPADEIEKGFRSLERSPAPFGHPKINGKYVSARDPEAVNMNHIGSWNENVRRENGRVLMDKVIDIEVAGRSKEGLEVLDALEKGDPIGTSTGLYPRIEPVSNADYDGIARDMAFDHDAWLLHEEPAATPEQGVGVYVNSSGNAEDIEVINSAIEMAEENLDWATMSVVSALEQREKATLADFLKSVLLKAIGRETQTEQETMEMAVDDKQFADLSAKVNSLADSVSAEALGKIIGDAVSDAVKPLTDNMAEMKANQEAKEKAELEGYVTQIVKANLLDEAEAKELTLNAAKALAEKAKPGKAAAINGAFGGKPDEVGFKLPKGDE